MDQEVVWAAARIFSDVLLLLLRELCWLAVRPWVPSWRSDQANLVAAQSRQLAMVISRPPAAPAHEVHFVVHRQLADAVIFECLGHVVDDDQIRLELTPGSRCLFLQLLVHV